MATTCTTHSICYSDCPNLLNESHEHRSLRHLLAKDDRLRSLYTYWLIPPWTSPTQGRPTCQTSENGRGTSQSIRSQYKMRFAPACRVVLYARSTHAWALASLRLRAQARTLTTGGGTHVLKLRPYQEQCLQACVTALARGEQRIGVSLPTGSGKTTVFLCLLSRIKPRVPGATRSLIIVNSVELAQQTRDHARRLFPRWSVEVEQGGNCATGDADMYVDS